MKRTLAVKQKLFNSWLGNDLLRNRLIFVRSLFMAKLMTRPRDAEQNDGARSFRLNFFWSWHHQTNPTCCHSHSVLHNQTETVTNLKKDDFFQKL